MLHDADRVSNAQGHHRSTVRPSDIIFLGRRIENILKQSTLPFKNFVANSPKDRVTFWILERDLAYWQ